MKLTLLLLILVLAGPSWAAAQVISSSDVIRIDTQTGKTTRFPKKKAKSHPAKAEADKSRSRKE